MPKRALLPIDEEDPTHFYCAIVMWKKKQCTNQPAGRLSEDLYYALVSMGANLAPGNRNLCELHAEFLGQFLLGD